MYIAWGNLGSMTTSTDPLYFEVPEQRLYSASRFFVNKAIYGFIFVSMIFSIGSFKYPGVFVGYVIASVVTAAGILLSGFAVKRLRPVIKKKVVEEFTKNTGISLPADFNPLELPARTVPVTLSLVGANGTAEEWTAARNGTYFRFAPK